MSVDICGGRERRVTGAQMGISNVLADGVQFRLLRGKVIPTVSFYATGRVGFRPYVTSNEFQLLKQQYSYRHEH